MLKNISASIVALVTEEGTSSFLLLLYSFRPYLFCLPHGKTELPTIDDMQCSGAHHVDFRSATKDDPDWLVQQRRQEVDIIHSWIDEYYADLRS